MSSDSRDPDDAIASRALPATATTARARGRRDAVDLASPTRLAEASPAPATAAGAAEPGHVIGDYVVEELIAAGGFGTVYRARHQRSGRVGALKILHPEGAASPEIVARFEREARAVNLIRHPNVVDVFDFGRTRDDRPYFVMDLLTGVDLARYLEQRGRVAPGEILELFEPLCSALAAAHAAGIIHRDVKPSNVFLADEGDRRRVVLLDFGVAKLVRDAAPGLTRSRETIGSPASMAPEQIRGEPVDPRTDVYALGILLFAALTGQLPFTDASLIMMQHMHLFAAPPLPSAIAPLAPALDEVVVRAMQKAPEQRHAGPGEFLEHLRRALGGSSEGPRAAGAATSGLAVHVEVSLPAEALDDPDPELLERLERLVSQARDDLAATGFLAAFESGNALLMVKPLEGEPQLRAEHDLAQLALDVGRRAVVVAQAAPALEVRVCLHVGQAIVEAGRVRGDVVRTGDWVTGAPGGVHASAAALRRVPGLRELMAGPGQGAR